MNDRLDMSDAEAKEQSAITVLNGLSVFARPDRGQRQEGFGEDLLSFGLQNARQTFDTGMWPDTTMAVWRRQVSR